MTDFPQAQDETPSESHPAAKRGAGASVPWMMVAQSIGCVILLVLVFSHYSVTSGGVFELALASGLLVSVIWKSIYPSGIQRDIIRLASLVSDIRKGRDPIESLSQFKSPVGLLSSIYADLICDLRQERVRTAELENEVRQRVATRTESLERTIGALRQQAAKDGLTGLFNRRMLDGYLPDAIERCKAAGTPLNLLMIDIDHFKPLNDTLGHAAGDQMLRSVAQIIRSTIRETDLAFRNGGDEFVVVLEGCNDATAQALADRLNSLGGALGRTFRLTTPPILSIGMTSLAKLKDATAPAMLREADAALYVVKAAHHAAVPVSPPRSKKTG
jgi:diguanylate cyclase (GGDEF)-like protein